MIENKRKEKKEKKKEKKEKKKEKNHKNIKEVDHHLRVVIRIKKNPKSIKEADPGSHLHPATRRIKNIKHLKNRVCLILQINRQLPYTMNNI